ncbi:MAG: PASTA domain-containing protein [Firmicutes bacterium]|nr:PASTA domain-containing protein [Bacillota bacterium]
MVRLTAMQVRKRIAVVFLGVMIGIAVLFFRLAYLQVVQNHWYQEKALHQRMRPVPVDAKRGVIYDRNLQKLAVSVSSDAVYAVPAEVENPVQTAQALASLLNTDTAALEERLTKKQATVWLARKLDTETARAIRKADLPGIGLVERPQRYYPHGELAAQVLGIAGIDNQGLEGLEFFYDEYLRGTPGRVVMEKDAAGRQIPDGIRRFVPPVDGANLVLTLDHVIQYAAERELAQAVQETGSDQGVFIAMDPKTGGILALAVYPSYDPNEYGAYPVQNRRNVAIVDQYEPGSTFKIVTASAALDEGVVAPMTRFYDPGHIKIGGVTVRCWRAGGHGSQTFIEAVENSCNPVFAQIGAERLGGERFYKYINLYGFGDQTGIDFPGEAKGIVPVPGKIQWGEVARWANVGFGQGIGVTPLQLLSAMATIANGGMKVVPHFMSEIRDGNGRLIEQYPITATRVLKEETAAEFTQILRSVVVNGSGSRADIPGYRVAGKTGTAQVAEGGRYTEKRVSSFVGFAPADDPRIAALVVLYHPKGQMYGGVIAAPVFQAVVEDGLERLGVPRRQEPAPKLHGNILQQDEISVPNVINFPQREAENILRQAGLKYQLHGEGEIVFDQVPAPGTKVPWGTIVQLLAHDEVVYDAGDERVTVPKVVGLSMREVAAKLAQVGLRLQVYGSGVSVKQDPAPGTTVPAEFIVKVFFESPGSN